MLHMSRQQDVIFPQGPLFLVSKGWKARKPSKDESKSTAHFHDQDEQAASSHDVKSDDAISDSVSISSVRTSRASRSSGQKTPRNSPDKECPSGIKTASTFQFVNATDLDCMKNPDLRKLIKSHVKKRSDRNKGVLGARNVSDDSSISGKSSIKPEAVQAKSSASAVSSLMTSATISGSTAPYFGLGSFSFDINPRYQKLVDYCES